MSGYSYDRNSYLRRLRRIEGQVRGLQRMIGEGCVFLTGINIS